MERVRVMLVEDSPDDQILSLRALRKCGIDDVILARDGVEALHTVHGDPGSVPPASLLPALILLDLKLPRIDGLEFLARLRADQSTRQIPVIITSSSHDRIDLDRCNELGVTAYLNKPITPDHLCPLLQELGFSSGETETT